MATLDAGVWVNHRVARWESWVPHRKERLDSVPNSGSPLQLPASAHSGRQK